MYMQTLVLDTLNSLNQLDLELWEFAKELVHKRMKKMSLVLNDHQTSPISSTSTCPHKKYPLPIHLRHTLGIHRPPGHKGPIDGFYK